MRVVSAGRVVGKELGTRKRWSGLFSKMGLMREVCEEVVEEEEEDVVAGEQEMDEMSPRKGVSEDKVLPPAFLRALEGLRLGESGTHRLVAAN